MAAPLLPLPSPRVSTAFNTEDPLSAAQEGAGNSPPAPPSKSLTPKITLLAWLVQLLLVQATQCLPSQPPPAVFYSQSPGLLKEYLWQQNPNPKYAS